MRPLRGRFNSEYQQRRWRRSCNGLRMPMERLDQIVIDEMSARVLHSDHLSDLLKVYL